MSSQSLVKPDAPMSVVVDALPCVKIFHGSLISKTSGLVSVLYHVHNSAMNQDFL